MKRSLFTALTVSLALLAASPAMADLIVNGGFETGTLSGWRTVGDVTISTSPLVISGNKSALIPWGKLPQDNSISQQYASGPSDWVFSMDFAVLPGTAQTSMNLLLEYTRYRRINMSLGTNGQLQAHQTGTVAGWKNIGTLTALTTPDSDTAGWDVETPVVNHLLIEGFFSGASPYYNVTLNGLTVTDLTYNQNGAPVTGNFVQRVVLQGYGPWLADNVSLTAAVVPEPASLVLLGTGLLGLLAFARQRRRHRK